MASSTLNFNIGVLGHIDSGKTSLSKILSTTASTASFDKNPQSQERGITIDLGFSSFCCDFPDHLPNNNVYSKLQFTLVDCPGHSSLIRTIIGGAQIVDLILLVIDVTKGIQTQTAECLVIAEICCDKMVVVLNKIDLISGPSNKKESHIEKMKKRIEKTLEQTKFAKSPIVPVAANPDSSEPQGIENLKELLSKIAFIPQRDSTGPLLISVDHCFSIRGQGTVMTGTLIQGSLEVNDTIEIPALKVTKKVKSMQMFKKPISKACQGDRVGICVTQFDPSQLERGLLCSPGHLTYATWAIASVQRIPYFKAEIKSKAKFHITAMHDTVMAKLTFFGHPQKDGSQVKEPFSFSKEYQYLNALQEEKAEGDAAQNWYKVSDSSSYFVLLEFIKPIILCHNSRIIGSHLDYDIHTKSCRLAFHGQVLDLHPGGTTVNQWLHNLKVYKFKSKEGSIDRVANEYEIIAKGLFKKETNLKLFQGLRVQLSSGEEGTIDSWFGQSGKVKIRIPGGLKESTMEPYSKKKSKEPVNPAEPVKVSLLFKRYIFDLNKKIVQT